jgi:octaprenyl-diphosphate synthase
MALQLAGTVNKLCQRDGGDFPVERADALTVTKTFDEWTAMAMEPHKRARTADPIAEISVCLGPELQAIEQILHDLLQSESQLLREVGEYINLGSGKKLRPMLTLLVARTYGIEKKAPVEIATALEAIHVATLLHDDVIDGAEMRRGRPSVNARWGVDVAILMADYLYASAFELALSHLDPEPLRLICSVTRRMCEGEMFQIERRGQWLTPDDYLRIISCKTAYLFSACGSVGGLCSVTPPEAVARLAAFGLEFGLAFQITDDALDYTANDEHWGKSVGIDLAGGKQTLPLILALRSLEEGEREAFAASLRAGEADLAAIRGLLDRTGALERTLEMARGYAGRSLARLDGLEVQDEASFELLQSLPEYVVSRRY